MKCRSDIFAAPLTLGEDVLQVLFVVKVSPALGAVGDAVLVQVGVLGHSQSCRTAHDDLGLLADLEELLSECRARSDELGHLGLLGLPHGLGQLSRGLGHGSPLRLLLVALLEVCQRRLRSSPFFFCSL